MSDKFSDTTSNEACQAFAKSAKNNFEYLIEKFEFELVDETVDSLNSKLVFERNDLRIELSFNIIDEFMYLRILKKNLGDWPRKTDRSNVVNFMSLVKALKPEYNLRELQPIEWEFETALKKNAELFKSLASEILSGDKWVSEFELEAILNKQGK